ncbi:MAG TPA: TonB-dependent receptor [Candidatus Dormibacteraeota bacterium]|nr:TonB-dependent receptor [Candidatus Dormibacteraeota bacterium]
MPFAKTLQILSRLFHTSAPALALLVAFAIPVASQVINGTILGAISDPSGKAVPNAKVTATNTDTGLTRTAVSGDQGEYLIPLLPPGQYKVRVEADGFKPQESTELTLAIDAKQRVDFNLTMGGVREEMVVNSTAPLVNTESSDMGQVIGNRAITQLPLNGRQFIQLALLTPAVAEEVKGTLSSPLALSGFSFNANGTRYEDNSYLLDGVSARDSVYTRLAVSPSIDAIEEFKVHTSNYSAEFGGQGGAQVNISTRSGTNAFHGTVYEFLRNDVFDARNFFDRKRPPFRQNQFGTSLGGPIKKDKTFFFGNYEGQRIIKGVSITAAVPSVPMRTGDFTGLGTIIDPTTGTPFPNNMIPANRIAAYATDLLKKVPNPTSAGLGRNWAGFGVRDASFDQFTTRLDHTFTPRDLFFGRFLFLNARDLEPIPGVLLGAAAANPLRPPGFGQTTSQNTRNLAAQYSHVFNPNLIDQFRFGYLNVEQGQVSQNGSVDYGKQFGFQGINPPPLGSGYPVFTIVGFSTFGDANTRLFSGNQDFTFHDDVVWTKGRHSVKFGGDYTRTLIRTEFVFNTAGQFTFVGAFTRNPFADFLLGFNSVANALTGDPLLHGVSYRIGAYVQDDWRVNPKLTLNLGLRYDLQPPYHERDDKLANFAPEIGGFVIAGSPGHISPSANVGRFPNVPFKTAAELGYPRALSNTDFKDFAPRIGIAYAPGHGLVFRGGYGIFYSNGIFGARYGIMGFNPPFTGLHLFLNFDPKNPIPVQQSLVSPASDLTLGQGPARNVPNSLIHEWNFSIEKQFTSSLMVEGAYVGTRGTRLDGTLFPNQPDASPLPLKPRLKFQNIAPDQIVASAAFDSWYHGMILRLEKRYSDGLVLNLNYTFSKSLDTNGGSLSNASGGGQPQFSGNIAAEKGRSGFDIRHRFVTSLVYDLPLGAGRKFGGDTHGFLGAVISGWQFNTIIVAESGQAMTPLVPIDRSNTGGNNDRPNLVSKTNSGPKTPNRWFNVDAFALQPFGTFGNAGRSIINCPGFFTVDMSGVKRTKLMETLSLEFRAEAFNILNRANFDFPSRVFNTPGFGQIFTAKDARELQFALKLIF